MRRARGNLICFRQFFQPRGHKTNGPYTRGMHDVYDPGDDLKLQSAITANEGRTIGLGSENLFQPAAQPVPLHSLLIDAQRPVGKHLNDDAAGCGSAGSSGAGCGNSTARPLGLCAMIIKMTSSTSKTSINGTTFISTKIPRFEPPTDIPMSHLVRKNSREEDSHIPESKLTNLYSATRALENSIGRPLAWR